MPRHISQLSHTPRVDVVASPQLPAVRTGPGGAHARSCVIGEPERAEELGQQVRRQQDIHAPRWERRHLSDEGVGLVLELGRALAGVHGDVQELRVREVGQAQAAHGTQGRSAGRAAIGSARGHGSHAELRQLGARACGGSLCQLETFCLTLSNWQTVCYFTVCLMRMM
eukprot:scaffold1319_cov64-Phaeocystis_antarctica.AAC.1